MCNVKNWAKCANVQIVQMCKFMQNLQSCAKVYNICKVVQIVQNCAKSAKCAELCKIMHKVKTVKM